MWFVFEMENERTEHTKHTERKEILCESENVNKRKKGRNGLSERRTSERAIKGNRRKCFTIRYILFEVYVFAEQNRAEKRLLSFSCSVQGFSILQHCLHA